MKHLKILVLFFVLAFVVLVYYVSTRSSISLPSGQLDPLSKTEEPLPSETAKTVKYLAYSDGILESNRDKRRVLFFYANWCPTCAVANPDITKNQNMLPDDVVVIRVNYNDTETDASEKALAEKYGVTYQHTFVQIDSNDVEVLKWNGGATQEIVKNLQ